MLYAIGEEVANLKYLNSQTPLLRFPGWWGNKGVVGEQPAKK